jgi:uncharacterized protein YjbI with pentapeptide repeats
MKGTPTQGIFLSYRRQDTPADARLLKKEFEGIRGARVFMDLDSIEPGVDFAERIRQAVDSSAVLVALIGPQWVTLAVQEEREEDYVLVEITTAVDAGVLVIPVLVNGAEALQAQQLPSGLQTLARLNAFELNYGRYQRDADKLRDHIKQELARVRRDPAARKARAQEEAERQDRTASRAVAEQYARAIEQLDSDKLDVRIGGIYALERVAQDSPRDYPTIMEFLTAFIREHSREPTDSQPQPHATRPDVQAAANVIRRRTVRFDSEPVNLEFAKLTGANLDGINLTGADLKGANFTYATLRNADLTGAYLNGAVFTNAQLPGARLGDAILWGSVTRLDHANLTGACLKGADFTGADLTSADLSGADLTGAKFGPADLTSANLSDADLTGADLSRANLTGAFLNRANFGRANFNGANLNRAVLTGANLKGAILTGANLTGARWPQDTRVPPGWQVDPNYGHLQRAAE